jgi:LmbE family N-acetylglucosaminyl deacetylase
VDTVDAAWAVREIVDDIRKFRPRIVLTFHHLGVSSHPDHIAVARFLDQAFAESPDGPVAYFEWGIPAHRAPLYQRPNLIPIRDDEIAAEVPLGGAAMDRKLAAIRAHETQYDFFLSLEQKFDYRTMATPEYFALRRSRVPRRGARVPDLWEYIDG